MACPLPRHCSPSNIRQPPPTGDFSPSLSVSRHFVHLAQQSLRAAANAPPPLLPQTVSLKWVGLETGIKAFEER
jgi:hypothetical protein